MWNDNKSCSSWTCSTGKCGKMMMPMMIIVLVLIIAWVFVYSNNTKWINENISMKNDREKLSNIDNKDMMVNKDKMMKDDKELTNESMNKINDNIKSGYKIYTPKLLMADKTNILFFAATWCPACQWADKNFLSETIPDNINLLKVDYDTYTDLKEKYGVTMQHTYVQVDENWNEIKKWSWSTNVADLLTEIK